MSWSNKIYELRNKLLLEISQNNLNDSVSLIGNVDNVNEEVTLSGWVATVRDLGGILFIELRDRSGFFQLVANPQINPDVHKVFEKVP